MGSLRAGGGVARGAPGHLEHLDLVGFVEVGVADQLFLVGHRCDGGDVEVEHRERHTRAGVGASVEPDDLDDDVAPVCAIEQNLQLLSQGVPVADDMVQHGLVEDGVQGGRMGAGQQLLAAHPKLDPPGDHILVIGGGADQGSGVALGLQQAGYQGRGVHLNGGRGVFQPVEGFRTGGVDVGELVPPAALAGLPDQGVELLALGVGDVVELDQCAQVLYPDTDRAGFDAADLRRRALQMLGDLGDRALREHPVPTQITGQPPPPQHRAASGLTLPAWFGQSRTIASWHWHYLPPYCKLQTVYCAPVAPGGEVGVVSGVGRSGGGPVWWWVSGAEHADVHQYVEARRVGQPHGGGVPKSRYRGADGCKSVQFSAAAAVFDVTGLSSLPPRAPSMTRDGTAPDCAVVSEASPIIVDAHTQQALSVSRARHMLARKTPLVATAGCGDG